MSTSANLDPRELRNALGRWMTGVAVITTLDADGEPKGLTVNSFSSVSLDPPLVLWSLARSALSYAAFASGGEFAVNILSRQQHAIARRFASRGGLKFEGLELDYSPNGVPMLRDGVARFVCNTEALHEGGDHLIIVGRVTAFSRHAVPPLAFSEGRFHDLGPRIDETATDSESAALIVVGNELLAGSTADCNGPYMARRLGELGLRVREIRVIGDDVDTVAAAVRASASQHAHVFVTGGLGPTHDDITAAAVAAAFGLPLEDHPDAILALRDYHTPGEIPEGRLAGARLPQGCSVVADRISGACGFRLANVTALPGEPTIAMHLFERATAFLPNGTAVAETSVRALVLESTVASQLRTLQERHPAVQIGCYPYFGGEQAGITVTLRSTDSPSLAACEAEVQAMLAASAR